MSLDTNSGTNSRPRLVFAGTPDFAATCLQHLLLAGHVPVAVYSQPDRPAGRGRQLAASPVKELALAHGIAVEQPLNFKNEEDRQRLAQYQPTLMIVVAYGLLLPQSVLDIPAQGCVNVHASLLPRWRGAAPIQRALLAGDSETGITLMQMEAGLDTGPMLATARTPINADDTSGSLHDRLAQLGAQLLVQQLPQLLASELAAQPQNEASTCYAQKLSKQEAALNWQQPAAQLARQVRAFQPWPVATLSTGQDTVRVGAAHAIDQRSTLPPGHIVALDRSGLQISTGGGILCLTRLQWPGGKMLTIADLLNGQHLSDLRAGQPLTSTP